MTALLLLLPLAAALPPASAAPAGPPPVEVGSLEVTVTITNHYAVTQVDTTLVNTGQEDSDYTITIASSELAVISRFAITAGGHTYESEVKSREQAQADFEQAQANGQAAGLIEDRDTSVRRVAVNVPAGTTLTTHLTYEELLYRTVGEYRYTFPLVATAAGHALGQLKVSGTVSGSADITSWGLSDGTATRASGTAFTFEFQDSDYVAYDAYKVTWREDAPSGAGTLLTHATSEGLAFVHTFSAEGTVPAGEPLPKDIVFVIDYSGSMSGTKIAQAKEAFTGILDDLRSSDRFSVVRFADGAAAWKGEVVAASGANVAQAKSWVEEPYSGGTNIDAALTEGLHVLGSSTGGAPILVFLTDGQPSVGVTSPTTIRQNLLSRNTVGAAVFTLGFGNDADETLLKQMALENHGSYKRIYEAQDASAQIRGFYATFGTPLYSDTSVRYSPEPLWADPSDLGAAYEGSDLTVVGVFPPGTERVTVTVTGAYAGGTITSSSDTPVVDAGEGVGRQVAYAHLKLLENRALLGDDDAKTAATDLALEYGFVGQFTSLIVVVPDLSSQQAGEGQAPALLSANSVSPSSAQYAAAPMSSADMATPGVAVVGLLAALVVAAVAVGARKRQPRRPGGKP